MAKNFTHSVEQLLKIHRQWLHTEAESRIEKIHGLLSVCESPVEQMLLIAIIQSYDARLALDASTFYGRVLGEAQDLADICVTIYPQRELYLGDRVYRVDIMVSIESHLLPHYGPLIFDIQTDNLKVLYSDLSSSGMIDLEACPVSLIAIEVDGHDFHEKTKEQARRDKERDRAMQMVNIIVLRYTGSEVFRNPFKVAANINDFVIKEAKKRTQLSTE